MYSAKRTKPQDCILYDDLRTFARAVDFSIDQSIKNLPLHSKTDVRYQKLKRYCKVGYLMSGTQFETV